MKKKFLLLSVVVLTALCFCLSACADRADGENGGSDGDGTNNGGTDTPYYTIAVYDGGDKTINTFADGTEIKITADSEKNEVFVCWLSDGDFYSFESTTTVSVDKNAVFSAVYANCGTVTLDYGGGTSDSELTAVTAYGRTAVYTEGTLYEGFGYVLPVPSKRNYTFDGWFSADGTAYTDNGGASVGNFGGGALSLVAVYTENPYVTLILENGADGARKVLKQYLGETAVTVTADEVTDYQCTGWTDADGKAVSDGTQLEIDLSAKKAGETYVYTAVYREAYKLTVIGGRGGGAYATNDTVTIVCSVPTGKAFVMWTTVDSAGEPRILGVYKADGKEYLCLIEDVNGDFAADAGDNFTYYNGTEKITAAAGTADVEFCGETYSFETSDLGDAGVTLSGSEATIKAVFRQKEYTMTFVLDCKVDGVSVLTPEEETQIAELGFSDEDGDGKYTAEVYIDYNEAVTLISVPKIEHYSFVNWQTSTGDAIPSYMPESNIEFRASFLADKHKITVKAETGGSAHIGASGNVTGGYYDYGGTISIYVTAEQGYEENGWTNLDGGAVTENIAAASEDRQTEIYYVFSYKVTGEETLTVDFGYREYTVTYKTAVVYDGENVTDEADMYTAYAAGYDVTTETHRYRDAGCKLKAQATAAECGLKYTSHWTLSGWKWEANQNISDKDNFVMPANDVLVTATYTIKSYGVGFSTKTGVLSCVPDTINGHAAEGYVSDGGIYRVPYGAKIETAVTVDAGFSLGAVTCDGIELTPEKEALVSVKKADELYGYEVSFSMLRASAEGVTYFVDSSHNSRRIEYYVRFDYDNFDPTLDIYDYISVDSANTKTADGQTYYLLTKENGTDTTQIKKYYNETITLLSTDASAQKYAFSGWTKMLGDDPYTAGTMPDADIWVYGAFSIYTYGVSIGTAAFEFDGDPSAYISTSTVKKTVQDGAETEFSEGEYRYYSSVTLEKIAPTGYDFANWRVRVSSESGNVIDYTLDASSAAGSLVTQGVLKYIINADGSVTVYVTADEVIFADYGKKTYTLTVDTALLGAKQNGTDEYKVIGEAATFQYASKIDLLIYTSEVAKGKKITSLEIKSQSGDTLETFGVSLDGTTYVYANNEFTSDDVYTENITVTCETEDIIYTVTYVVYDAMDDLNDFTLSAAKYTFDGSGSPFAVKYNETITLETESALKTLLGERNVETDNVMYAGWYQSDLSASSVEGAGFIQDGIYNSDRTYTHKAAAKNAVFYTYLINLFEYSALGTGYCSVSLNENVRNTENYRSYFDTDYKNISLPAEHGTDKVTAVSGFYSLSGLVSVTFSENIATIGESAFSGCVSLEEAVYDAKLATVGKQAFYGCVRLGNSAADSFPASVSSIGEEAFFGCSAVTEVVIPYTLSKIANLAFGGMVNLSSVVFDGRSGLNFVSGEGTSVFGDSGASAADGITLTIGPEASTAPYQLFGNFDETLKTYGQHLARVVFSSGTGAADVTVGGYAFAGTTLSEMEFSARITEIGTRAFYNCAKLLSADMSACAETALATKIFSKSGVKEVVLPSNLSEIGLGAFSDCVSLVSVYYGNALVKIFGGAFGSDKATAGEMKLERMVPSALRAEVLADGTANKYVEIPATVTEIGDNAFTNCAKIAELRISCASVSFGNNSFSNETALSKIIYDAGTSTLTGTSDNPVFEGSGASETTLEIGSDATVISDYLFLSLSGVKNLTVPANVTEIGSAAFGGMTGLVSIAYEANANADKTVSLSPFSSSGAAGLTVTIAAGVTVLGENLFNGVTALSSVVFLTAENGELTVKDGAFSLTSGLKTVELPKLALLSVETGAFDGAGVTTMTINADTAEVIFGSRALSGMTNKGTVDFTAFGTTYSGLPAQCASGNLTVTKGETGYTAAVGGTLTTLTAQFSVKKEDVLALNDAAVFNVNTNGSVYGTVTLAPDAKVLIKEGVDFTGFVYSADELDIKNDAGFYTTLDAAADITANGDFSSNASVKNFKVDAVVTVTFPSAVDFTGAAVTVSGRLTFNGAAAVGSSFSTAGSGAVTVAAGGGLTVSGIEYFGSGAFAVSSGEASLSGVFGGYDIVFNAGSAVEINSAYSLSAADSLTVNGSFDVKAVSVLPDITLNAGSETTIEAFTTTGKVLSGGTVYADAYISGTKNYYYYPDIASAVNGDYTNDKIMLLRDIGLSEDLTFTKTADVDFNGFALTSTAGIVISGNVVFEKFSFTTSSAGTAVTVSEGMKLTAQSETGKGVSCVNGACLSSVGDSTLTSMILNGQNGVTAAGILNLTLCEVTAESGDGIVSSQALYLTSCGITAENGDGIVSSNAIFKTDSCTVTASGIGIELAADSAVATAEAVEITADKGIYATGKNAGVTVSGASTVTGVSAGIYLAAGGSLTLSDTAAVSATAARITTLDNFTGAVVLINSDESVASLTAGGDTSVTNNGGDAILNVMYTNDNSHSYEYTVQCVNVTGGITAIDKPYTTLDDGCSVPYGIKLLDMKTDFTPEACLLEQTNTADVYFVDIYADETAAYVEFIAGEYAEMAVAEDCTMSDILAAGKKIAVIKGKLTYTASELHGTIRALKDRDTGTLEFTGTTEIASESASKIYGILSVTSGAAVTVNGGLFADTATNSGILTVGGDAEINTLSVECGAETTVNGKLDTNTLKNDGLLTINGDNSIINVFEEGTVRTGTLTLNGETTIYPLNIYCNLTVGATVSLTSNLTFASGTKFTVNSAGTLAGSGETPGTDIILSSGSGAEIHGVINAAGFDLGAESWCAVSSAVSSDSITGRNITLAVYDGETERSDYYVYCNHTSDIRTVAATCEEIGYTYDANVFSVTLSDGGTATYGGESQHLTETAALGHNYNTSTFYTEDTLVTADNGTQYYIAKKVCANDSSHKTFIALDKTLTVADAQETLIALPYTVSTYTFAAKITAEDTGVTLESLAGGNTVTIDGVTYYLIPVVPTQYENDDFTTVVYDDTVTYYILAQ